MDGARGNALECALALLRAPAERHALRQRPLPAGVDVLLGIAAGAMPDELAEAAYTFNETAPRIREAAQFYAREVLFFPQADAYRVLGVEADASPEQIKAHHRLLQHWLHPDRLHSEDDSVFASRVNAAWNQLRNPARRQAYDRQLQQDRLPVVLDGGEMPQAAHAWVADEGIPRSRWRHRLPMLALSASCVFLVVLILRDMERVPDTWKSPASQEPAGPAVEAAAEDEAARPPIPAAEVKVSGLVHTAETAAEQIADPSSPKGWPVSPSSIETALPPVVEAAFPAPQMTVPITPPSPRLVELAMPPPPKTPEPVLAASPPVAPSSVREAVSTQAPLSSTVQQSAAETPSFPTQARIKQAWDAGEQLLRYMETVGKPPPPIWSSPAIQSGANQLRETLHNAGRVKLSDSQWRIGNENAVLTSGYVLQGDAASTGRLTADLVWREDRWLVTGLSVEGAQ